jgi:acetoin:2,6-dichlorophenolindophenol oxidoreductase subunit alpha
VSDKTRSLRIYELMLLSRKFDDLLIELFRKGQVPGFIHNGHGQEAIGTGACLDARQDDYVFIHHRGFAACITKGLSVEKIAADLCGKATGYNKGKGGFHIADPAQGVLGISGSVGACFPLSVGVGLSARAKKAGQVILCFFGDGTANRELFGSSLNMAALWKLPIIFICENNSWGLTVPYEKSTSVPHIADRAPAYGMPGVTVDGNDVFAVNEAVNRAIDRARTGEGPSLVECMTWRLQPHAEGYPYFDSKKSAEEGRKYCPVERLKKTLEGEDLMNELDEIAARVVRQISSAREFVLNSPLPQPEEALQGLYVNEWGGERNA